MSATLVGMGRKRASETPEPKKQTSLIRVDADLARWLAIISTATGQDIAAIVSPILRPHVVRLHADAVRKIAEEGPQK
jgi:hypothetical protein